MRKGDFRWVTAIKVNQGRGHLAGGCSGRIKVIKVKRGAFWEQEVNGGGGMAAKGPA